MLSVFSLICLGKQGMYGCSVKASNKILFLIWIIQNEKEERELHCGLVEWYLFE